ncbi:MAG: AraC family transcriptional regulator [Clostridia bacterium]|nr:AraC family transcriptional regulator [Clostridia bacterium]
MTYEIYSIDRLPGISVLSMGCAYEPESTRSGPILRNAFVIHYCISGHGYYLGNKVSAGQGFIFLPGTTVNYYPSQSDPWKYLWFIIDTPDPEFFLKYYELDRSTGIFTYDFTDVLEEQYRNICRSRVFSVDPVESLLVYLNILNRHSASKAVSSKAAVYAKSAKDFIETNYHRRPTISELAKHLNISQSYLYRVFSEEYGVSPKEYLNSFCMDQAKKLLRTGDLNVSQIAASVGYSDVLAFSAFFSKRKGCSPTAYRERTKKAADSENELSRKSK